MFKETPTTNETETVIGPSVKVEGDFVTEGNVIVEGIICGTIKTSRNLKVGPKSRIFANVAAENALVSGEIQGNLKINDRLELTSTGKIFGDIKVGTLIVAAGSVLNGKCQMGTPKEKSIKPDFSKQEKIDLKTQVNSEAEKIENKQSKKK
ncbi:MAG: polymer-forming cytoskeletal protein [Candidatus Buchananbacteria bacterium]|nr:polymer-forming cytoskeletal protein [Candidatus Buchananbacteria bacterium]